MQGNACNDEPSKYETSKNCYYLDTYLFENTEEKRSFKSDCSYPDDHNPINPLFALLCSEAIVKICSQNDEDNWMEIWNNVFMEYNKLEDSSLVKLTAQNVDTGM